MGFGLLFIGYFLEFLLGMNQLGVFTYVIGYMVMIVALSRLRLYCRAFSYAQYSAIPLLLLAVYRTFVGLTELFDWSFSFVTPILTHIVDIADIELKTLFHILLTVALVNICNRTGVKKNSVVAIRNILIFGLYAVTYNVYAFSSGKVATLFGILLLLQLLSVICNLLLLGSCYMRICPAGEENMDKPKKPSRFAFVNEMRDKYQKSEDKAIREDRAYRQQRYDEQVQRFRAQHPTTSTHPKHERPKTRAQQRAEVQAAREAARRRRDL